MLFFFLNQKMNKLSSMVQKNVNEVIVCVTMKTERFIQKQSARPVLGLSLFWEVFLLLR